MKDEDDIVMRTYVRSKVGLGPSLDEYGFSPIDDETLTDRTDSITSLETSLFKVDHGLSESEIIRALEGSRERIHLMMESIDRCMKDLERLRR